MSSKKPFLRHDLLALRPQPAYSGRNLDLISFPLGGIGTGSIGLSGRGGLVDWEIFNRPNIGSSFARTFPVIWARQHGEQPVCRVLMAPPNPPYQYNGMGEPCASGEGLPHMDSCTFRGEYPFAWIDFACRRLPVKVVLEAYNPFVPTNPEDSGFPAAILRYTVANRTKRPVDLTVAWSLLNMIGSLGQAEKDPAAKCLEYGFGNNINVRVDDAPLRGLAFATGKYAPTHPRFGSFALVSPDRKITVLRQWSPDAWFAPMHQFWDTFSATGEFPDTDLGPSEDGKTHAGALGVQTTLRPGLSKTLMFYFAWYFPNFEKYWGEASLESGECCAGARYRPVWKNHYAEHFTDALDVARLLHRREKKLHRLSLDFHDAVFNSSVPPYVIDAVSSQLATLKSTTCIRLTDGTFYGFEGCCQTAGCCEGSCTHVWNYQQALPFLFPSLERSMRSADYRYNMRSDGSMCFRLQLPLGATPNSFHACVDGQLGGIINIWRDWKVSGDEAWLRDMWPGVQRALEYAWRQWDTDKDGVIDGVQHNTYDIEFAGPNPLSACIYLGALEAAAQMAEHFGNPSQAAEYRAIGAQGRSWVEKNLFNGEYLVQRYNAGQFPKYQFGNGCLSDQLLGQWLANVAGLGHVLDARMVRRALKSVFKFNWRSGLKDHANAQRVYALSDEAGLLLCSWPRGGRPAVPFPYSDEVWTGVEYQVASHLITEGMLFDGLAIVKGARQRYDGHRRNPWNEFECGSHYARAMSSYGLLLALSGFTYDKGAGRLGFAPKIHAGNFKTFWALDGVWGTYSQKRAGQRTRISIEVHYGRLRLKELEVTPVESRPIRKIRFRKPRVVRQGGMLSLTI
ncbi:MAG TPA: GH116 family glycosyl hydrolase [Candidatus Hydrogenedentes bacterium]|nr:GH116 family glycosyl hydrolase [Candidatus Hydrogenedentota bacterium]